MQIFFPLAHSFCSTKPNILKIQISKSKESICANIQQELQRQTEDFIVNNMCQGRLVWLSLGNGRDKEGKSYQLDSVKRRLAKTNKETCTRITRGIEVPWQYCHLSSSVQKQSSDGWCFFQTLELDDVWMLHITILCDFIEIDHSYPKYSIPAEHSILGHWKANKSLKYHEGFSELALLWF